MTKIMTLSEKFSRAYNGSYYTAIGCGGNIDEWIEGYDRYIRMSVDDDFDIHKEDVIMFSGADMNSFFGLTGTNAYDPELKFLAFSYRTCSQIGKLAIFKLSMRDRWFDDIVDNNARREDKAPEDYFNA